MNLSFLLKTTSAQTKVLPAIALLGCLSLVPSAQAQLTITLNPVSGDNTKFVVSGSGSTTASISVGGTGYLSIGSDLPYQSTASVGSLIESVGTGTLGGVTISDFGFGLGPFGDPGLYFTFPSFTDSSPYSFSEGTLLTAATPGGFTYETYFNTGTYSMEWTDGFWSAAGPITLVVSANSVSAVPEPGSFAAIAGVLSLGFVSCRRRRRAV